MWCHTHTHTPRPRCLPLLGSVQTKQKLYTVGACVPIFDLAHSVQGFANRDLHGTQYALKHSVTLYHSHTAQALTHTFQHGKFMHAHHCGCSSNVCVVQALQEHASSLALSTFQRRRVHKDSAQPDIFSLRRGRRQNIASSHEGYTVCSIHEVASSY